MHELDKDHQQLLSEIAALKHRIAHLEQSVQQYEQREQEYQQLLLNHFKPAEQERDLLLVQEKAIRAIAEVAERRAAFLAEASRVLASSLDYETTLASVTQLAVPTIADWCVIDMLEADQQLQRLAIAHQDPEQVTRMWELYHRYPPCPQATSGPAHVLRTGKPELAAEIPNEALMAYAQNAEHLAMIRSFGIRSSMVVPLVARDRILGTITLATAESERRYGPADLVLAEDLARRVAAAVDNARLYHQIQIALEQQKAALRQQQSVEQKLTLLVEASSTLISSLELPALLPQILNLACSVIAADAYAVWRFVPSSRKWEVVSAEGLSEAYQRASISVTDTTPGMPDEPYAFEDVQQAAVLADRWEGYRQEGIRSLLVLPLKIYGTNSGTLTFYYRQRYQFSDTEVRVGMALANLSASAIGSAELYQEQKRLRAEAETANRIKDEFLAVLSHELRTPLNPILGWAKLLRSGRLDSSKTDFALETIERNAKLQTQLIEDLLDVSRILRGKLSLNAQPVDLTTVITAAIETVQLAAEAKSIKIQTYFEAEVGKVLGDINRLQQVVWNLLSNAVKFTPAGGQVEVRLETVHQQAQIRVTDTGSGIDPEFLPYIFEYFRQADSTTTRSFGGLGLGLAIARQLVELHGGVIQAASAGEGEGATFVIRLPLWEADKAQSTQGVKQAAIAVNPQVSSYNGPAHLTDVRLLLVEDEPDTRELVTLVLQQAGAEVTAVSSATAALQALQRSPPDLLISDIGMPEVDGYTLLRQVRSLPDPQGGQVPALALTAYAGEINQQQAIAAGFQQHVAKPIEPNELVRVVATLLGKVKKP